MLKKIRKSEKGQAMVEFALVLPLLLILLCGIIDFGWLYYNQITLNNAAREGARYAVINYDASSPDWASRTVTVMETSASGIESVVATVSNPTNSQITATVTAEVPILTGFTATLIGENSKTLSAQCVMRLEN